jgi:hypothetical protein
MAVSQARPASALRLDPAWGLGLAMFLAFAASPAFPPSDAVGFRSAELSFFGLVALVGWFTALVMVQGGRFRIPYDPILWFMAAFFLLLVVSIVDAPARFRALLVSGQYLPYYLLAYLVIACVRSEASLRTVMRATYLVALAFNAVFIAAALAFQSRGSLDDFMLRYFVLEVSKTIAFLQLPFALAVHRWLSGRGGSLDALVVVSSLAAIALSASRGSLGGAIFTIALAMLTRGSWPRKIATVTVGLLVGMLALLTIDYVGERMQLMVITSQADYEEKITAFSRVYTALVAFELMRQHPLNGTGSGNLSDFSMAVIERDLDIPPKLMEYWERHYREVGRVWETTNTPLKLGAELGVGGFLCFFAFYLHLWRRVRRAMRRGGGPEDLPALAIFVVASLAVNMVSLSFTNYYTWFFYGIVIAAARLSPLGTTRSTYAGAPATV